MFLCPSLIAFVFLPLLLYGCAGNPAADKSVSDKGTVKATLLSKGRSVKNIAVNLNESNLKKERVDTAKTYTLTSRIENNVQSNLQEKGSYDSKNGDITLNINITAFRLRSGSSAFWLGAMAGADVIAVDVDVEANGENIKSFKTDTSTILGGMAFPAPSQRVNRMSKELAKRIVENL